MKSQVKMLTIAFAIVVGSCGGATSDLTAETTTSTSTAVTTTVATGITTSPVVPGEDLDVDEIVAAYTVAFDSATSYTDKAAYVLDFEGLETTVDRYAAAGDDLGGIHLRVDEVGVAGDEAKVIYAFVFGGNPTYSDLEGDATRTEDGWKVTRQLFCDIMGSARVGCP